MRISDWSSDVCSSDLAPPPQTAADAGCVRAERWVRPRWNNRPRTGRRRFRTLGPAGRAAPYRYRPRHRPARQASVDRKSVGEGKSVSVRVDLGGRRIIKKKKKKKLTISKTHQ